MSDSPFREQHVPAPQVRAILSRVLGGAAWDPERGRPLTRGELEQLLVDLGVPPEGIPRAIDGEDEGFEAPPDQVADMWGGPRRIVLEAEIDGELRDDRREDVVEVIREAISDTGQVSTLGSSLTWTPTPSGTNQPRKLAVKMRVRDGRTRVRVEEDLGPIRVALWIGLLLGGGGGLGGLGVPAAILTGSPFFGVLVALLILLGFGTAAYALTKAISARRRKQLEAMLVKVKEEVRRGVSARARVATPELASVVDEASLREAEAEAEAEASLTEVGAAASKRR